MRVALCFSGQPRYINQCADYIKNTLYDAEVDVFAHLWFGDVLCNKPFKYGGDGTWLNERIDREAIADFRDVYKPTLIEVQYPIDFIDSSIDFDESIARYYPGSINNPLEPDFRNRSVNNILSYFYSLNKVLLLKKEHEYKNNFKYDFVVKCRTDNIIKTKIDYNQYNAWNINYSNINNQPDGMICDWLVWGGSYEMDIFMSPFSCIDAIINKCLIENNGAFCPELIHRKMIDTFGIDCAGHNINIELPRF